jgi:hypothetical protein
MAGRTSSNLLEELGQCVDQPLELTVIRRAFLLLARHLFSDPGNLGSLQDKLCNMVWDEDPKKSKINIDLDYTYSPDEELDRTPAIFVGFSQLQFRKVVLDNSARVTPDNSGVYHNQPAQCNLMLQARHQTSDGAYLMGQALTAYFMGIRPLIMNRLGLRKFDLISLGRPEMQEQAPDRFFKIDVNIALDFNFSILTTQEGHRLKKFFITNTPENC